MQKSVKNLTIRANEQTSSLEQTANTLEKITSITKTILKNAD